jgi:hypothetical protein
VPSRSISPRLRAPRGEFTPSYVTRKRLTRAELLTAAGIGAGVALAVFYVAKVWLERTPVLPPAASGGTLDRSTTSPRPAP